MHTCGQSAHTHAQQMWCTRTHGRNKWWATKDMIQVYRFNACEKLWLYVQVCAESLEYQSFVQWRTAPFFGPANFMRHSNDGFYYIYSWQTFCVLNYKEDKSAHTQHFACLHNSNHAHCLYWRCMLNILWYSYDVCSLALCDANIWIFWAFGWKPLDSIICRMTAISWSLKTSNINCIILWTCFFFFCFSFFFSFKEMSVVIFPHEYNFRKTARVAMHDVHDFYCFRSNSVNIIFVYCGCYRKYSIFLEFFRTWNIDINTRGMECVSRNVNFCRT